MKLLIALVLFTTFSVQAMEDDKKLHFAVSGLLGSASYLYTEDTYKSIGICTGVGLAKEVYDEYSYGGFDKKDLMYDISGCLSGVLLADFGIKVFTSKDQYSIIYTYNF